MGFARGVLGGKAALDALAGIAFGLQGNVPMFWTFFGFFIADLGLLAAS